MRADSGSEVVSKTALDHLRRWHLRKATGTLACDVGDRTHRFHLVDGEIRVASSNSMAKRIEELPKPSSQPGVRGAWEPLLERIAVSLDQGHVRFADFQDGVEALPPDLAATLPTPALLRVGYSRRARLATDSAATWAPPEGRLTVGPEANQPADALGWTVEELWVLERLRSPGTREELRADCPFSWQSLDGALAGLMAIRLVGPITLRAEKNVVEIDELAKKLASRIGESLAGEPLSATAEEFRQRIADLLGRAGVMGHDELLGVDPSASPDELQSAFEQFARWVHPGNADRFGLADRREALRYLFERGTEAYRTLADPLLRVAYFAARDIRPSAELPGPERRRSEATESARQF